MLDLIRHMAKACQDSLNQCDDLVRLILRNVGTYTNDESAQTGKWLLERSNTWMSCVTPAALGPVPISPAIADSLIGCHSATDFGEVHTVSRRLLIIAIEPC